MRSSKKKCRNQQIQLICSLLESFLSLLLDFCLKSIENPRNKSTSIFESFQNYSTRFQIKIAYISSDITLSRLKLINHIFIKSCISKMSSKMIEVQKKGGKQLSSKELTKRKRFKSTLMYRIFNRGEDYVIRGYESESFNRRKYQLPIQSLSNVTRENIGFTNNIMMYKNDSKKSMQLFVPAYVSLKVKSIQQIEIKDLLAQINCVLIIIVLIDGFTENLQKHLEQNIMVQVNRGDSFQLKQDSTKIKLKKEGKFLKFIVRAVFPVQIYDDIFLSPFQILNLVLTVTMNSIFVPAELSPIEGYKCKISFNCMRNPEKISISYVSECRLGVYDLAEQKLVHYPSSVATYDEIKTQFYSYVEGRKQKSSQGVSEQSKVPQSEYNIHSERKGDKRLSLTIAKVEEKSDKQKIAYFQYSHFVIPVYKYPGNAWATIFIPIFMLGILSTSLFFYKASPAEKIGTIATIVLGFIALIPSIKDQLPPSQKITLSEIIVYAEAINCMLSLSQHVFFNFSHQKNIWKSKLLMVSLALHLACFAIACSLLILHKFWWEPSYNSTEKALELSPLDDKDAWNNPYCDDYFLSYNASHKNKLVKFNQGRNEQQLHLKR